MTGRPDAGALADLALDAARLAADLVRGYAERGVTVSATKTSAIDVVTEADRASETLIRDTIRAVRPDDAFLGEEDGLVGDAGNRRRWYVDPLCGTLNFAAHTPLVGVNVALSVDGVVTAATVVDPFEPRTFSTTDDLRPTPLTRLVDVDFDVDREWSARVVTAPAFTEAFGLRVVSSSLAAVWVADGRRAGYVYAGPARDSVHFAAPVALCLAAGCVVSDLEGRPYDAPTSQGLVVGADAATHAALLLAVRQAAGDR